MKLRIQDNSLRFRLTRSEVQRLDAEGRVESSLRFTPAPNDVLTYALETSPYDGVSAVRTSNEIRVTLPQRLAHGWANSGQISIEQTQSIGPGGGLQILIEKDFHCIHRDDAPEKAADLYPNPNHEPGSRA